MNPLVLPTDEDPRALVVDDDEQICLLLNEALQSWGFCAKAVSSPLEVHGILLEEDPFQLVFLDVYMPQLSGLKLISEVRRISPASKILVMTGHADKETVVRSLREGAFDFIEKPFDLEFLRHTVQRALETHQVEQQRRRDGQELQKSRQDLFRKARQLQKANQELQDANTALSVLARNIERSREESEQEIVRCLRMLVQPLKEELDAGEVRSRAGLIALIDYLEELASGLPEDLRLSSALSMSEYRIAALIKQGMTSQDIADQLNISPATVKTHRRNIRRKLDLAGTSSNLQTHLQAM